MSARSLSFRLWTVVVDERSATGAVSECAPDMPRYRLRNLDVHGASVRPPPGRRFSLLESWFYHQLSHHVIRC